ncbi:MAG: glycosyltransferase family 4 protein [Saprospiraceae bacterium]|nr:glycosyltransferase family 4 protein [Saprospiraceae bacterium]
MSKLTDKPIEVIPNCINTDLFSPVLSKESGEKIILLISSYLFKHKQVDLALQAMKILKDKSIDNVELRIVGIGPEMKNLRKLSAQLELEESVKFMGLVLNRNLPQVMREADILLVTCPNETFCVALIEGLACGLKAVIPIKGEPAVYTKDFEVTVVNEHTPDSYAHEIAQLIGSTFQPDKLNQYEIVKATFSIEKVCQKLHNIYKSVL